MTFRAHSFDVFDTCLVRTHGRGVDVLSAAAERVVSPGPGASELISELVRRRLAAEHDAVRRQGSDAVPFDAIYEELGDLSALGVPAEHLREAELAVERDSIRPVRAGRERVRAARAAGMRVLFVSDMHLPPETIRDRLEAFQIAEPADPLYVSGEVGRSKRTGSLFDYVLQAEHLRAAELVHTGDDPVADDEAAIRRGVAVRPLLSGRSSRLELAVLAEAPISRRGASAISGLARAMRTVHAPEAGRLQGVAAIAAAVVAPLFTAYVAWVLRAAREAGVARLYFVSRDAEVMLGIARRLWREGDPECRYLYGSRQAWLVAGVDAVDRRSLAWLLEPQWALRTPRALLTKLDVAPEELGAALRARGLKPDDRLSGQKLERFWEAMADAAPVVLGRAAQARGRLSRYLEQEGLYAPGRWALVDIGWRLTAQRALRRVLAADGHGDRMLGYYLGLTRNRAPLHETGPIRSFLLEDDDLGGGPAPDDWIYANTSLVEQAFAIATHGSCTGYAEQDGRIVPTLREQADDPVRVTHCETLHAVVEAFAEEAAASGLVESHIVDLRAAGLLTGRLLVEQPTRDEAEALGALRVGDDQNETRVRPLAGPLAPRDVALRLRGRIGLPLTRDFETDHLWREGSLALTPAPMRAAFLGMKSAERAGRRAATGLRRAFVSRRTP